MHAYQLRKHLEPFFIYVGQSYLSSYIETKWPIYYLLLIHWYREQTREPDGLGAGLGTTACSDPKWCRFGHGTRWRWCDRLMRRWHRWQYQCGQVRPKRRTDKTSWPQWQCSARDSRRTGRAGSWQVHVLGGGTLHSSIWKVFILFLPLSLPHPTRGKIEVWRTLEALISTFILLLSWTRASTLEGEMATATQLGFLHTFSTWRCIDYGPQIQNLNSESILLCHQLL